MQLVIDIPKKMYKNALNGYLCGSETLVNAIKNGITLPKGHGRLIDADHYIKMQWEHPDYSLTDDEPIIIEADRSEEE